MPVRKKVRIAAAVLMVLSLSILPLAFVIDTSALGPRGLTSLMPTDGFQFVEVR